MKLAFIIIIVSVIGKYKSKNVHTATQRRDFGRKRIIGALYIIVHTKNLRMLNILAII